MAGTERLEHAQFESARLEITKLSKTFGVRRVLHQFSLTVVPGEVVAVVGPNGSGKSTLLKMAAGLLRPSSGQIVWAGNGEAAFRRKNAAYAAPDLALYPELSGRENLRFFDTVAGRTRTDADYKAWVSGRTKPPAGTGTPVSSRNSVLLPAPVGPNSTPTSVGSAPRATYAACRAAIASHPSSAPCRRNAPCTTGTTDSSRPMSSRKPRSRPSPPFRVDPKFPCPRPAVPNSYPLRQVRSGRRNLNRPGRRLTRRTGDYPGLGTGVRRLVALPIPPGGRRLATCDRGHRLEHVRGD